MIEPSHFFGAIHLRVWSSDLFPTRCGNCHKGGQINWSSFRPRIDNEKIIAVVSQSTRMGHSLRIKDNLWIRINSCGTPAILSCKDNVNPFKRNWVQIHRKRLPRSATLCDIVRNIYDNQVKFLSLREVLIQNRNREYSVWRRNITVDIHRGWKFSIAYQDNRII